MKFSISDHCGKVIVIACWWNSSALEPIPLASPTIFTFIPFPIPNEWAYGARSALICESINFQMEFSISYHCGKAIVVACWWYSSELEPMPLASLALSPFIKLQNWTQKVHFSYGQFSKFFFQASTIDCLQCLNPPLNFYATTKIL